ncbi:UNVERIFIED_CONTAM: hypothetical protein FKN15_035163 [Acipenser sinensis]
MSLTSWFLVSSGGTRHRLPREMIFVGRDDCELMLQRSLESIPTPGVDKQHAVINYDSATDEHKVKDLGSLNGTFVNDVRIQEQMYITLKMDDKLRFGYDILLELHEKFTSQLRLTQKTSEGEGSKAARTKAAEAKAAEAGGEGLPKCAEAQKLDDKMSADMAALHRGTPLYGQPSWWGDDDADDENSFNQETKAGEKKLEGGASGENKEPRKAEEQGGNEEALISLCREPSYFEIPTKEFQQAAPMAESTIHEIPTKDTEGAHAAAAGHASFTIEFDENTPGKVTIKDHMTKFNPDQLPRSKKSPPQGGKELSTLQATMIAAESKVSDWLAQNNPPMARRESTEDDSKSIKSDVPIHLKRLKGSKHEDGTQSDSENGAIHRHTSKRAALEEHVRVYQGPKGLTAASAEDKGIESTLISRTAFMVEFFDEDNPRKHRSYSFTQNGPAAMAALAGEGSCPTPPPRANGLVPMDCKGVPSPLATPPSSKPHRKQKSGDPSLVRSSASVGQQTSPNEEPEKPPKATGTVEKENEDDQSDKGTYTIELENRNPEEEEARRMIDKVDLCKVTGSKHEDGTQSDSENGASHRHTSKRAALEEHVRVYQGPKGLTAASAEDKGIESTLISRTAFMVEFFDEDNPRKHRSYSFTQNGPAAMAALAGEGSCPTPPPRANGLVPMDCKGVPSPLATPPSSKPHRKQKSGDPSLVRSSASVGQQTSPNEEPEKPPKATGTVEKENEDDQSDKGTYTIELENRNPEEEEARRMIDKVDLCKVTAQRASCSARARQPSLDLTDDDQTFSLPHFTILDILSSDQETYSGRSHGRGQFTSTDELLHSKLEASKTAKTKTMQASSTGPCKPATLPRPRPTRASLLRKARLGETSDNELTDADKVSVASEVSTTSSTAKPPSGRKTPSRIDMLAQPRRIRLGSLSARSDSEATVNRSSASSRTPDSAFRSGLRPSSATDGKIVPRMRANSVSKLPDVKSKISFSTHSSPSEDEFGSNRNSPKHGRLRPGTTLRSTRLQTTASPGPGGVVLKHRMREQEEYIRDWTAHSEEIARISQDLAKDLATLAREIHDVAGEIDSESSPSTVPSTTVSTAATTPGSVIDTREELVDRVFDESLNFRKISPALQNKAPEINGRPVELRPRTTEAPDPQAAIRRRTWSRDEAVLDSLLLTSVSQLSSKIRQAVDKTAGKISPQRALWSEVCRTNYGKNRTPVYQTRILFKDKDRNWEEIENKLRAESDMPLLKTSNKPDGCLFFSPQRALCVRGPLANNGKQNHREYPQEVINVMVDPDGTLDALSSLGLTSPVLPKQSSSPSSRGARAAAPPPGAPELRTARLGLISASSELDSVESNRDFSLHYNRFNPSGEEGDSVVHE